MKRKALIDNTMGEEIEKVKKKGKQVVKKGKKANKSSKEVNDKEIEGKKQGE